MIKFNPTTPMQVWAKESTYIPGEGHTSVWINKGVLYCEWRGAFGDRVTAAQALGVRDSATVRTFYHPDIYAALRGSQAVIIKNADPAGIKGSAPDKNNPNVYELWAGVDNIAEENQRMEFRVRRYEGK